MVIINSMQKVLNPNDTGLKETFVQLYNRYELSLPTCILYTIL